jgi:putative membrane protein
MANRKTKIWLLVFLILILTSACINPVYPNEIFLQHITTAFGIVLLTYITYKNDLSNKAFLCIIIYLVFHIIGARWNYSYTPYDKWMQSVFGLSINSYFGFVRNQYDRLVHFMYGFLLVISISEICTKWFNAPKRLSLHIAFLFILATSTIYELLEWMVAVFMSPTAAEAYNGQQGDFWDAQKDMALAMLGAILMIIITIIISYLKRIKKTI